MRKFLFILTAILILFNTVNINAEEAKQTLKPKNQQQLKASISKHADQMMKEFRAGNLDKYITYMNPVILKSLGGKEKLKKALAPSLPEALKKIVNTSTGKISDVVNDGGRLAAFVPVTTTYRYEEGKLVQNSYRIASSADNGATWTFMDGQGRTDQEEFFKKEFPVLTKLISFPKCKHEKI